MSVQNVDAIHQTVEIFQSGPTCWTNTFSHTHFNVVTYITAQHLLIFLVYTVVCKIRLFKGDYKGESAIYTEQMYVDETTSQK